MRSQKIAPLDGWMRFEAAVRDADSVEIMEVRIIGKEDASEEMVTTFLCAVAAVAAGLAKKRMEAGLAKPEVN